MDGTTKHTEARSACWPAVVDRQGALPSTVVVGTLGPGGQRVIREKCD